MSKLQADTLFGKLHQGLSELKTALTFVDPVRNAVEDKSGSSVGGDGEDFVALDRRPEVDVAAVDVRERIAVVGPEHHH